MQNLKIPNHLAIIMDGNGRFAQSRLLPRIQGHFKGQESVVKIVESAAKLGVKILTLYAFSTENWLREKTEIDALMQLFEINLQSQTKKLNANNIKLKIIGRRENLSVNLINEINKAEHITQNNDKMLLQIAIDYGGKQEILDACKNIVTDVLNKKISVDDIDLNLIEKHLYSSYPVDLCIRTSGEFRISNFLLWQNAYAEFYITDVLWPDFNEQTLIEAIMDFTQRKRRFGGV